MFFVTDDLQKRHDPFREPLKYKSEISHLTSIEAFGQTIPYVKKSLHVVTPQKLSFQHNTSLFNPNNENCPVAAAFSLNEDFVYYLKYLEECIDHGIPVMLISDEFCRLEFIEFDFKNDQTDIKCLCKFNNKTLLNDRRINGQKFELKCKNNKRFCTSSIDPDSNIHKAIKKVIKKITKGLSCNQELRIEKGHLPIYRYSDFLDLVSFRSHMGLDLENKKITKSVATVKEKRNLFGT